MVSAAHWSGEIDDRIGPNGVEAALLQACAALWVRAVWRECVTRPGHDDFRVRSDQPNVDKVLFRTAFEVLVGNQPSSASSASETSFVPLLINHRRRGGLDTSALSLSLALSRSLSLALLAAQARQAGIQHQPPSSSSKAPWD